MRALSLGFLMAIVFVGNGVSAEEGRTAAARVCQGLFHQSDKTSCLAIVEAADSFEPEAVAICAGLFHTNDKVQCLRICADKVYLAATLQVCAGAFHTTDKIDCLTKSGKKAATQPSGGLSDSEREFTVATIRRAIRELREHDKRRAIELLHAVIDDLERAKYAR